MEVQREAVEPAPTVATDRTEATTYDPYAGRRTLSVKLTQAIYLIVGLVEVLLLVRFVLKALAANAEVGFAQFIYSVTGPLVAPFVGLFGASPAGAGAVLEPYTILAVVVYGAVGWLLARLVWLLVGETRSAHVARTDSVQTRSR
jgi:YggT family protein